MDKSYKYLNDEQKPAQKIVYYKTIEGKKYFVIEAITNGKNGKIPIITYYGYKEKEQS